MTTVSELNESANRKNVKLDKIHGIEFKDLPNLPNGHYIYLMLKPGEIFGHYTVIIKEKNKSYYIDPFGCYPEQKVIDNLNHPIKVNTFKIQDINSNICGPLCISMLKVFQKSKHNKFMKAIMSHL